MARFEADSAVEIERVAQLVEDTISALGVDPSAVRLNAPTGGRAWSLMRGSAAMAIFLQPPRAKEDSPFLRVISPIVVIDPEHELTLYRKLLELNATGMASVAFGIQEDRVVAVSERPTRNLNASEVRYIVQMVGAVADHFDDELTKAFGGSRVSDQA